MVRQFEVRKTRKGDNFGSMRLNLGPDHGFCEVEGVAWGLDGYLGAGHPVPAAGDVLEVSDYKPSEYQGRPQWVVQRFHVLTGERAAKEGKRFVPPPAVDEAYYRARLEALIESTDSRTVCGQVLREVFDSAGFREAFFASPAAAVHHQNYPGGLLEHTINVTGVALALADAYGSGPQGGLTFNRQRVPIDREVLVAAGLLHDIGKLETYRMRPLSEVTETNSWEGHLAHGYATVRRVADPLYRNPPYDGALDELNKLFHCILSHHGTLEFGSPVVPACAEALLLAPRGPDGCADGGHCEVGLRAAGAGSGGAVGAASVPLPGRGVCRRLGATGGGGG